MSFNTTNLSLMKRYVLLIFSFLVTTSNGFSQEVEVVLTTGHVDMINTIAISPDGEWFASGSVDKTVKMVHVPTGRELRTFADLNGVPSAIKFSPNSKMLAGLFNQGEVKVWDVATGKEIFSHPANENGLALDFVLDSKYVLATSENTNSPTLYPIDGSDPIVIKSVEGIMRMCASTDGESLFGYDYKGKLHKIAVPSGEVLATYQVQDEFVYAPAPLNVGANGEYILLVLDDLKIHIIDAETLKPVKSLEGHDSRIWATSISKDGKTIWSCEHNGNIFVWDVPTGKKTTSFKPGIFSTMSLAMHPKESFLFIADGKEVLYIHPETGDVLRRYKPKANKIVNVSHHPATNRIVAVTTDVQLKLWDLELGKIDRKLSGFWPVIFTPDGKSVIGMGNAIQLTKWNVDNGEKTGQLNTDNELIQNLSISNDGNFLAGGGFMGVVKIWNLSNETLKHRLTGHSSGIYATHFSPDGKLLVSSGGDGAIKIWEVNSGKLVKSIEKAHEIIASDVKFSPDGKFIASAGWDMKVHIWETETWTKVKTIEGHTNIVLTLDWHPSGEYLATGAGNNAVRPADNSACVWDVATGDLVCRFTGHTNMVNTITFDPSTKSSVISCGDDGAIRIWDFKKCAETVSLLAVNSTDHIITTPDHYYMASREALDGVSFRKGADLYPFEQFDLWLNRPDIVLNRMGKTNENLVQAYEYVHRKRVERNGFDPDNIGGDFHLPQLEFVTKDLPVVTKDSVVRITVRAQDTLYKLDRINVRVNDVPVDGVVGSQLHAENVNSVEYTIAVRLTPGDNSIAISAVNERGTESLVRSVKILRNAKEVKGTLYLVAMGVSEYKDEQFNLKYAAKDARDIERSLKESGDIYDDVKTLLLNDQEVTIKSLDKVTDFVKQASPDDVVIIFLAGHGVLDADFNYYYAAYDMDFNNPAAGGIPYSMLNMILKVAKARKKLLLMDTCHSGEVDKDEMEQIKSVEVELEEINFRNAGVGVRSKTPFGFGNSVQLMQGLFTDLNVGTGATVISSSGGAEFAIEGDDWQNGLFTYTILQGVSNYKADKDWNRHIYLNELRSYVYQQVVEMSNGQQKPGTREENIRMDFRVR